ncbi:PaaX family transcriptional regulator C-terminal domain-containing protein [Catellatospora sp. KI3]|uniref:PaaX family transcriptional regulator n=1 Tax=Catellatospora sp. KI3 TaxID=3041620 RepID=UPI0024823B90|nr:PaaX family transcriptional regulator C-terminal domain-containing protein [Catellatospora sp. KI3]MDI1466413.1 PaaX family transcriptional regulator C-terminal domain-containing protein [Catellatospora sp. KI3]
MVSPFEIEEIFPDVAAGSRLPRRQEANPAQGLAATLVADYTLPTRAWLPTAAIMTLLGESGVSAAGARAAISRLARRGVLESSRHGRHSAYRLTREAAAELSAGGAWIARFGTRDEPWDGCWTLVAFSLPQEQSSPRRTLRGQLRWLGFAPLYDGLWISPDLLNPTVRQRLSAVALGAMTVFRAEHVDLATATNRDPIEAWDIAAISRHYEAFDRRWGPLLPDVRAGLVSGSAAVRARAEIMDTYRRIPLLDPQLPIELMPADWPRARAREVFTAVYDGLAEQAEEHVRAVVGESGDHFRADIAAHKVARMAAA